MNRKGLTYGAGIVDTPSEQIKNPDGTVSKDPIYAKWSDMLMRCYSAKYQSKYPTYQGCFVCPEWLLFSNFKDWMKGRDWQGLELDKDIIIPGNKEYSPRTCALIPDWLNKFFSRPSFRAGDLPTGVSLVRRPNAWKYRASLTAGGEQFHLGLFDSPDEAKRAYDIEKTKQAYMRIGRYSLTPGHDKRVIAALLARAETGHII
jgi:hypothetical protein